MKTNVSELIPLSPRNFHSKPCSGNKLTQSLKVGPVSPSTKHQLLGETAFHTTERTAAALTAEHQAPAAPQCPDHGEEPAEAEPRAWLEPRQAQSCLLTTDPQDRTPGAVTRLRKYLQEKEELVLPFRFLLGSKSWLDASHHSGPQEAGLHPETVPSPLPKFQSQKAQLVRDQGLPRGGGAASRALRSPCAASSGVAENQRGRAPAAWRGWPRCWRSGRRT